MEYRSVCVLVCVFVCVFVSVYVCVFCVCVGEGAWGGGFLSPNVVTFKIT